MGVLCNGLEERTKQSQATIKILHVLIKAHGVSGLIRHLQYAMEAEALDISQPGPRNDLPGARNLITACHLLNDPYEAIKNTLEL